MINKFLKILFSFVFLILFIVGYSQNNTREYNIHISKGDSLFKLKKYKEAIDEFQKASELMPFEEYPRLQMQRIETILSIEEFEKTKQQREAISDKPITESNKNVEILTKQKLEERQDSIKNAIIQKYSKELEKISKLSLPDEQAKILEELSNELIKINEKYSALTYLEKSLKIYQNTGNTKKASDVLEKMGKVMLDSGLIKNSIDLLQKSVELKIKSGDSLSATNTLNTLAKVYESTYQYDRAIESYNKVAEIKRKTNDKKGLSEVIDKIGNLYYKKQILDKSAESYKEVARINEELNDKENLGTTYNKLGIIMMEMGKIDEAEKYFKKSLELKEKTKNIKEASMALNNLGNLDYEQNQFKKAANYYKQSIEMKEKIDYIYGKAIGLYNLGNVYRKIGNLDEAIKYYEQCKEISLKNNYEELLARSLKALSLIYREKNMIKKAQDYEAILATTSFVDVDIERTISESKIVEEESESQKLIKYLTEEYLKQKELAEREAKARAQENLINSQRLRLKNEQIRKQRILIFSISGITLLVIVILILIYYQMLQKKRANKILEEKNKLISKQAKLIYDNIRSASVIQKAAMPPDKMMQQELPSYFILNMPKDIVSGDFYWMEKREGNLLVAVADCTGHGVQGAVVSMLGMALLNEIVNKNYNDPPGQILNILSNKLKESLHASSEIEEIREGMDIVLCKFKENMKKMQFAGANNGIYIIRKGELTEYKGDRSPIGYYSKDVVFTTYDIELEKGDSIYMFSDGYIDQLNGENYKKFLSKRFKELLLKIEPLDMEARKNALIENFYAWKGNFQQVDDILILCIKI